MENTVVYLITSGNEKQYVGVSKNLRRRLNEHILRDSLVSRCLKKHGISKVEILASGKSFEDALILEKWWIEKLGTLAPNGLNVTEGGYGSSGAPTPDHVVEQRREMMRRRNAATPLEVRERNWRKGIEKSAQTPWSEERRAKHAERMRRQHAERRAAGLPPATSKAISVAADPNNWTAGRRDKIRKAVQKAHAEGRGRWGAASR